MMLVCTPIGRFCELLRFLSDAVAIDVSTDAAEFTKSLVADKVFVGMNMKCGYYRVCYNKSRSYSTLV